MHLQASLPADDMPPEWAWPLPWEVDAALEAYVERLDREAAERERDRDPDNQRRRHAPRPKPTPVPREPNLLYQAALAQLNSDP